ncbi:hypothetical protein HDU86_007656 [Geranomyces michiganensis]|nr:hypothetical protein HDU86_007656 [Geranomyces michiganensis]
MRPAAILLLALPSLHTLASLPGVSADICSYVSGRVYRFSSMVHANGTELTAAEFVALAGPMWQGHLTDCPAEGRHLPDSLEIQSAITGARDVVAKPAAAALLSAKLATLHANTNRTTSKHNVSTTDATPFLPADHIFQSARSNSRVYLQSRQGGAPNPNYSGRHCGGMTAENKEKCEKANRKGREHAAGQAARPVTPDAVDKDCHNRLLAIVNSFNEKKGRAPDVEQPTPGDPGDPGEPVDGGRRKRRSLSTHHPLNRRADTVNPATSPFDLCLPLASSDPIGNPYHESLTGMVGSSSRTGFGYPIILNDSSFLCTSTTGDCIYESSTSRTIDVNVAYSVSTGSQSTMSKLVGATWGKGVDSANAIAVGSAMDQTWSNTTSTDEHTTNSNSVAVMLSKTHEEQKAHTHTYTTEHQFTNTDTTTTSDTKEHTWDTQTYDLNTESHGGSDTRTSENSRLTTANMDLAQQQQCTQSAGESYHIGYTVGTNGLITATVEAGIAGENGASSMAGATLDMGGTNSATTVSGRQRAATWDNAHQTGTVRSDGGRTAHTEEKSNAQATMDGHSTADADETRKSDSITGSITGTKGTDKQWGSGTSDMRGGSVSSTLGVTNTLSTSITSGMELSTTGMTGDSSENGTTHGESRSYTISATFRLGFGSGTCKKAACLPTVSSVITPWACKNPNNPTKLSIITTELQTMLRDESGQKLACTYTLVDCDDHQSFRVIDHNVIAKGPTVNNVLRSGRIFGETADDKLVSANSEYTLSFLPSSIPGCDASELVVKHFQKVVWSTGITKLGCFRSDKKKMKTRFLINDQGQLIQEAQNILVPGYGDGNWLPVWSSVPSNMLSYTVGVWGDIGYSLVLQDDGVLTLYDGVYAKVWSSLDSKHSTGYKYPINTVIPTVYKSEDTANDPRNSLPTGIVWKSDNIRNLESRCSGADIIRGGEGLISPSGNVTFHLEKNGNAVFKQYGRTLWESRTVNPSFADADATYMMTLGESGTLYIRDNKNRVIWQTLDVRVNGTFLGPYSAVVTDSGKLEIYGNDEGLTTIWSSWRAADGEDNGDPNVIMVATTPTLLCDKCFPCRDPKTLPRKPFINLATSNCTGPTGVDADCTSDSKQWVYHPDWKQYRNWAFPDLCLGGMGTSVNNCTTKSASYVHYPDGFLRLRNYPNVCIAANGTWTPCTNGSSFQKRWYLGPRPVPKLESNGLRVLLSGERIVNGTAAFGIFPNGTMYVNGLGMPKLKQMVLKPKPGNYYFIEVQEDGEIAVKNQDHVAVAKFNTAYDPQNKQTSLPRTLRITEKGSVQVLNGAGFPFKFIM